MKLIIIFLLFFYIYADDYEHHSEKHINKELSHLDLSKTQNKQIKIFLKEFRVELKEYRELKKEIEEQRKEIFLKKVLDLKEFNKLNLLLDAKAHAIENKLLAKIHIVLNLKQRIKFIYYFDDWEVE